MIIFHVLKDLITCREDMEDGYRLIFQLMPIEEQRQPLQRTLKLMLRAVEMMEHIHGYLDLCFERKFEFVYGE